MSAPKEVIWHRDPHTAAKHDLLRRYLLAWAPILLTHNEVVTYAEGFAGPGVYEGGEAGSPVIAHQVLAGALRQRARRIKMVLVEEDPRRKNELERRIAAARTGMVPDTAARLEVSIAQGACHPDLLPQLSRAGSLRHPMFVLLDGFGGPEVPFDLLRTIAARNGSNEVMITFQPQFLYRFAEKDERHRAAGDAFFGGTEWHGVFAQASRRKMSYLREQYRRTLGKAGFQHSLVFEMIDEGGRVLYLVFGTRHPKGVEKMKDAMWKVDTATGVRYRDPKDPQQQELDLTFEPDTAPLHRILVEHLRDVESRTVDQLQQYTLLETVYRPTQVITLLKRMRDGGEVGIAPGRITRATTVTAAKTDVLF
ncbi:three-Cys-motif partner protein TcmP [Kitasatospora sp. NPDC056181]|uniref:three-Cys-motif partner protein TcmP n=1 Tax=Kitasatospora sp. NPDC056181 TaxID=3345737 RepID=UPI0035D7808C